MPLPLLADGQPVLPRRSSVPDRLAELRARAYGRLLEEEAALGEAQPVSRRWAMGRLALVVASATPAFAALLAPRPALASPGPRATAPQYGVPAMYGNPSPYTKPMVLSREDLKSASLWRKSFETVVTGASGQSYIYGAATESRTVAYVLPSGTQIRLSAVPESSTGQVFIVASDPAFLVWDGTDLLGCRWADRELVMTPSLFTMKVKTDSAETIAKFAESMTDESIQRGISPSNAIHVELSKHVPDAFWSKNKDGKTPLPTVYRAWVTDQLILKIGCSNASVSGMLSIDLRKKKLESFQSGAAI